MREQGTVIAFFGVCLICFLVGCFCGLEISMNRSKWKDHMIYDEGFKEGLKWKRMSRNEPSETEDPYQALQKELEQPSSTLLW